MPDPNLALNGLAFDALQALAFIFTLLAATLFALLLTALALAVGTQIYSVRQSAQTPRRRFARAQVLASVNRRSHPLRLLRRL